MKNLKLLLVLLCILSTSCSLKCYDCSSATFNGSKSGPKVKCDPIVEYCDTKTSTDMTQPCVNMTLEVSGELAAQIGCYYVIKQSERELSFNKKHVSIPYTICSESLCSFILNESSGSELRKINLKILAVTIVLYLIHHFF